MKGDIKMDCVKCITNGIDLNRKMAKAVLFGAITEGVTAGAYVGIRKIAQLVEDKRLARYYEDEIEEILQEKEKMQFYEDEFKRQEKEEEEALAKAVDEFNSRRLKRDECPHCSSEK